MTLREVILDFLQWNDRNGCFTDAECIKQGYEPFTMVEAVQLLEVQLNDLCISYTDVDMDNLMPLTLQASLLLSEGASYQAIIDLI